AKQLFGVELRSEADYEYPPCDIVCILDYLEGLFKDYCNHISWKMSFNPMYIENDVRIIYSKVMEIQ
ncbi:MAG: hypothetical protein JTJ27_07690, partial [Coprococcus sp.]|nr:hypothetical protein [Coprococcus sp.]